MARPPKDMVVIGAVKTLADPRHPAATVSRFRAIVF